MALAGCSQREQLEQLEPLNQPTAPPAGAAQVQMPVMPPTAETQPIPPPPPTCGAVLYVTEIHADPGQVRDRMGEYVELYNAGDKPVRLAGWRLSDGKEDSHVISADSALVVPPKGFVVLGANDDIDGNGGVTVDYVYDRFGLSNKRDRVKLEDPCGTTMFDLTYPLKRGWPRLKRGRSIEQTRDPARGGKARWRRATNRMAGGDYGTPGYAKWMRAPPPTAPEPAKSEMDHAEGER